MSIGLRAVGIGMLLAVLGGLLLGWRHQRTPILAGTAQTPATQTPATQTPATQTQSGVEEGI